MTWKAIGFNYSKDSCILAQYPRIFVENGKIGVKDILGRIVVPTLYNYIERKFIWGVFFYIVGIDKDFGVYNDDGKLIVPVKFRKIEFVKYDSNSEGFIGVKTFDDNLGLYSIDGKVIINPEYNDFTLCKKFVFADKIGVSDVYNYEGVKILSSTQYKFINYNGEIILHPTVTGKWKVYNKDGKSLQPGVEYEDFFMHDEFLSVKLNGHWKILYSI